MYSSEGPNVGSHRVLPLSGPHFWLLPLGFLIELGWRPNGRTHAVASITVVAVEGVRPQWKSHWNTVRLRTTHWDTARRRRKFATRSPARCLLRTWQWFTNTRNGFGARSSTTDRMRTRRRHVARKSCTKLLLGWRYFQENHWSVLHRRRSGLSASSVNPSAWGHLNPSSYCDVGRLFYGVFKLWSKLCRE